MPNSIPTSKHNSHFHPPVKRVFFSLTLLLIFLQSTPVSPASSSSSLFIYRRPSAHLLQATQSSGSPESRKIVGLPSSGKPLHDPSKLGGTAKLNDKCDLNLYQKYGKKIYETLAKGEDSTSLETEFMGFLNQNASFEYYREASCFGYSALQFADSSGSTAENYGSILNFYKCDPKKLVCLCYDEKPLKHVNDIQVPTGCRLEDCKHGQECDVSKYEGVYSKIYEGNLKQLTLAKTEEEHQKAVEKLYKDRGDYFLLNDGNFASMQSVCESEDLNLECKNSAGGNGAKCECRAQAPNFKFKFIEKKKTCEAELGSWCNFKDVRKQGICGEKVKCEQIFGDYSKLSACGGAREWCRRKEEGGGQSQNSKCAFNPNGAESQIQLMRDTNWGFSFHLFLFLFSFRFVLD